MPLRRLRIPLACLLALILVIAAASPASAARNLRKTFWGPTQILGQSQFPIYKDLGVKTFQTEMDWSEVAPTRPANPTDPNDPAYRWPAAADDAVAQAPQYGMDVLLLVSFSPEWANGGHGKNFAPVHNADYTNFVRAVAARYPSVRRYMIWGEPCRPQNWQPLTPQERGTDLITPTQRAQVRRYAKLLDTSYGTLKGLNRRNLVIGGNSWSFCGIRPLNWVKYMRLSNGQPPRMDMYGHNPFTNFQDKLPVSEAVEFPQLPDLQKAVRHYLGRKVGIWLSEFTIPTAPDIEFNFYVSYKTQASWLKRSLKIAHSLPSVKSYGWLYLYDSVKNDKGNSNSGGLLTLDGQRKPAYETFKRG